MTLDRSLLALDRRVGGRPKQFALDVIPADESKAVVVDIELSGWLLVSHLKPAHAVVRQPSTNRVKRRSSGEDHDVVALGQAAQALSGARQGVAHNLVTEIGALPAQYPVEIDCNKDADRARGLGHALTLR